MNSEQFLALLESRGLVPQKAVATLRRQVTDSNKPVSATRIAMLLVEKGYLTSAQAESLLASEPPSSAASSGEGESEEDELTIVYPEDETGWEGKTAPRAPRSGAAARQTRAAAEPSWPDDVDDLTVVVPEDAAPHRASSADSTETDRRDDVPLLELDDDPDVPEFELTVADWTGPQGQHEPAPADAVELAEDALTDEAPTAPASTTLAPAGGARRTPRWVPWGGKGRARKFKTKRWDSPLMMVGGGGLILLLLLGLFLFFYLRRGLGDELFQLAEKDYQGGFYSQSIVKYEKFLSGYPRHPKASLARVKAGLARLRQVVEDGNDWGRAFQIASEVLPQIKGEEAFANARPEVAGQLTEIYAGFAEQAKEAQRGGQDTAQAQQYVDQSKETLKLIENSEYVPTSVRQPVQGRIESIQSEIELVVREINRDKEFTAAIQKIRRSTASGNTAEAYEVRRDLLRRYPRLVGHPSLHETELEIARREGELVGSFEPLPTPLIEDDPLPAATRVVMSRQTVEGQAAEFENQQVCVLARGAVYGLDAATGRVLWRRFVGYQTTSNPVPLSDQAGTDHLVVDGGRNELIRVESATGKLVWGVPLGESFAEPVVRDARIYVATRSGKLLQLDAADGRPLHGVSLPQRLDVAPAIDPPGNLVYQLGRHSSLFVLAADGLQCRDAFYLGHEDGTVAVPPVSVKGHVIMAENAGTDYCRLHVVWASADENSLERRGEPIRLTGQVVTPPAVSGSRVVFATDRGSIHVFEVDAADGNQPVREVARTLGTADRPVNPYALLDGSRLWIGQLRLSKYELLATRGELSQKWARDDGDVFLSPLVRLGQMVVHVRQRQGASGISVTAIDAGTERGGREDGQPIWETEIAVPLAGAITFDADQRHIVAVSAHGDVFEIDGSNLRSGIADKPAAQARTASKMLTLHEGIEVDAEHSVYPVDASAPSVLILDRDSGESPLRMLTLRISEEVDSETVQGLGGALLVPTSDGPVHLVDLKSGDDTVAPFLPRMEPGMKFEWSRPAVIESQDAQFVIAEANGTLYHVGRKNDPEPHLAVLAQVDVPSEIVAPLALAGGTGYLVRRGADGDVVAAFDANDLSLGNSWELKGRVVWGPERAGDAVMVACDAEGLICIDADQNRKWTVPLEYGPLAGRPEPYRSNLVLNSVHGAVWMIDAASGKRIAWSTGDGASGPEVDHFDVGEPLAGGPVLVGQRLILAGRDGTLHVISVPNRP